MFHSGLIESDTKNLVTVFNQTAFSKITGCTFRLFGYSEGRYPAQGAGGYSWLIFSLSISARKVISVKMISLMRKQFFFCHRKDEAVNPLRR